MLKIMRGQKKVVTVRCNLIERFTFQKVCFPHGQRLLKQKLGVCDAQAVFCVKSQLSSMAI